MIKIKKVKNYYTVYFDKNDYDLIMKIYMRRFTKKYINETIIKRDYLHFVHGSYTYKRFFKYYKLYSRKQKINKLKIK
jgi:hypothetical protein